MHDIPREDVFYMPYTQQVAPAAILPPGTITVNPVDPPGYKGTAHGYTPPEGSKWKMYTRATTLDVFPEAQYNKKII